VPGQFLDQCTVNFLKVLNANEVIGLDPELGVRFFKEEYLTGKATRPKGKSRQVPVVLTSEPATAV